MEMISLAGMFDSLKYLVFIFMGFIVYLGIMKQKYSKEVEGKIYGEFFAKNGQSYGELCKEDKGSVAAPKGHEIGSYFISNECAYDFLYPPGKMKLLQTKVRRSVWIENNPVPKVATDPSKWIESTDQVEITSFMIEAAANESFQKSALEMQKTFWGEISEIAKFVKNMPYTLYASIASAGISGIAAIFAYLCYQFMQSRFP